jgi:hypothetical protein
MVAMFRALFTYGEKQIHWRRTYIAPMLLYHFFSQVMSTKIVRNGITQVERFSQYKIPKIFTKLVLMFSPLIKSSLIKHEYRLQGMATFDDLKKHLNALNSSKDY